MIQRTKGVEGEKIALMGVLATLPLLGGLILFSFCRRLQNHTRITSFSMFSWSAIMVISSEVGFWFCLKRTKTPFQHEIVNGTLNTVPTVPNVQKYSITTNSKLQAKSSAERFKYSNRRYFSPLKSSFLRPL